MKKFKLLYFLYAIIALVISAFLGKYFNIFSDISDILFYVITIGIVAIFGISIYMAIKSFLSK